MEKKHTVLYLEEYILMCLYEIRSEGITTEFVLGEVYAYIECLEIIWQRKGVDNQTMLALEAKYGIR